jgi:hypothetical protein
MSKIETIKQFETNSNELLPLLGRHKSFRSPVPPKFPDKFSAAIRMALRDLEAAENTPGYVVDMGKWYENQSFTGNPVCHVCLAGAVIARAGQCSIVVVPGHFDYDIEKKLQALDSIRSGNLAMALCVWHHSLSYKAPARIPRHRHVAEYFVSPAKFKQDLLVCADILEKFGE